MNLIDRLIGSRTKPTVNLFTQKLAEAGAQLMAERQGLAESESALLGVAVMTGAEHATAEAQRDEHRRAIIRLDARIAELQKGLVEAQKTEQLNALKARGADAQRRVDVDAPKLLDRAEALFREAAQTVDDFNSIERDVAAVNEELRAAGLETIEGPERRYRREPDQVIPEVRRKRKKWVRKVAQHDGRGGIMTYTEDVSVFAIVDGKSVPTEAGAYEVEVEDVTPEQRRPGRWLDGLAGSVRLPPARIGGAWHWPKG
jgi:hypothetical protein